MISRIDFDFLFTMLSDYEDLKPLLEYDDMGQWDKQATQRVLSEFAQFL
jgi:hypothetical protein